MKGTGKRRIVLLMGILMLAFSLPFTVYATTTKEQLEQAQKEKQETEGKLSEKKGNIEDLKGEQSTLKGTLNTLNGQLSEVSDNLSELEDNISEKENEIEVTTAQLEEAQNTADTQYAAMKKRIQFMYEKGDFMYLELMLSADSFSSMINYADYVTAISEYDRKMLTEYEANRDLVASKKEELEKEKEELSDMKVQVEAEKSRVSGLVSKTSGSIAQYAGQISSAEEEALAYEKQIADQEANIAALKKKLAEEMAMSQLAAASAWRDISEVTFADGDRYLLANLIYCEAGGEPYAGQLAVGSVVINRVLSSVYPDSVVGVIYQNRQFSPVASGRLALALAEGRATARCYQAADEAMSGATNVGNCVYFRTPIEGLSGISIGGHIFY